MPNHLFAVPVNHQHDVCLTIVCHHLCHINAPPLISLLRARFARVRCAFCQQTRVRFDQQTLLREQTIYPLSVDRQPHNKSEVCPNPAITPKRMVAFNNPNWLQQRFVDNGSGDGTTAMMSYQSFFLSSIVNLPTITLSFSFSRSSLVCCCAF